MLGSPPGWRAIAARKASPRRPDHIAVDDEQPAREGLLDVRDADGDVARVKVEQLDGLLCGSKSHRCWSCP
jgi:hypothetical protein